MTKKLGPQSYVVHASGRSCCQRRRLGEFSRRRGGDPDNLGGDDSLRLGAANVTILVINVG